MSARQPFFSARPASESQGTAQGFKQTFLIDSSNPLHLTSPPANQSESMKTAFSVPGPFSGNGAASTPQAKTSGLGNVLKKKITLSLSQSVEKDRKGSSNSVGFSDLGNVRPGTAAPRSELHQDRATVLEAQHGFGYQNTSRRSLGLLDPGNIVRPGTTVPQSKASQSYAAGLDIRAPIPKPAASRPSVFLSHNGFSDRILENDAHISTTEIGKQGATRRVDDVGDLTFHYSTKGTVFNQTGPQRVLIEQQFGQHNASDVDLNATVANHEITTDGRLKMTAFGHTKKRNREIEEEGDGSYWLENQTKRHKSRHHEEFETNGYTKTPPFSPRPQTASSGALHTEGDVARFFPDARGSPGSPRYGKRRTASPVNKRHTPPDESPQAGQAPDERRNAFEKLLGRNTDAFVQQNMEKYDALVKKWSECSEEEWIAGAEVIAGKYEKIVTYVKNAMIAKINAYANIQVDIGRHLSDLGERDELLDAARKKLIMESGNALG